jgi:hypothetical protein
MNSTGDYSSTSRYWRYSAAERAPLTDPGSEICGHGNAVLQLSAGLFVMNEVRNLHHLPSSQAMIFWH